MIRLTLDKKTLEDMVGRFNRRLQFSTEEALDNIGTEISDWLHREQQKGTAGGWPQLSAKYAKRKEREYPGRLILTRKGTLMATYPRYITINRRKRQVALGFPRGKVGQIAMAHQYGYPPKNLPARPFPVDQRGYDEFEAIAYRNFAEAVRKAL
jgi:hypothetical protein